MKDTTQQEREMPIFDEVELELRVQPDMHRRDWFNRRYDYHCGQWRYDWHQNKK